MNVCSDCDPRHVLHIDVLIVCRYDNSECGWNIADESSSII